MAREFLSNATQRERYEFLRFLQTLDVKGDENAEAFKTSEIKRIKEKIRKFNKEDAERIAKEPRGYAYGLYGECFAEFIPVCDGSMTREEAEELFEEDFFIHYRPTYYDCTGQLFTSSYHLLKHNGDWWAIHHVAMDI